MNPIIRRIIGEGCLTEMADGPIYPYRVVEKSSDIVVWEFKTDEGVTVEVTARQLTLNYERPKSGGAVRVDFESDKKPRMLLKMTTVLRIYKTITMGIVSDIIKRNKPEVLYFSSSTMSRANIAYKFLKAYEKQGWSIQRTGEFMTMTSSAVSDQAKQALKIAHSDKAKLWHRASAFSLDDYNQLAR